ncbi:hypothetical protein MRX96_057453 [Rhipicephalus microplus]
MAPVSQVILNSLTIICLISVPLSTGKAKHQLKHEIADVKKVFDNFDSVVAIFDIDKDGDLDCLSGARTYYDKHSSTATYVWFLKGLNGHKAQNISYEVRPGPKPNQFLFKNQDTDEPVQEGTYDYTDYKSCVVMEMPYNDSEECVLWVTWNVVNDIPQDCQDQYEDNCDDAKLAYDKESCGAFENFN